MRPARGVVLVPHSRCALGVSVGACGFYRSPSPARLRKQVHPLVSFTPLQSSPFRARSTPPGVKHLPWGRHSLFATSTSGVLCATGLPLPATLPSLAFLTPSTVYSATGLCGFVSPHCHVQGLPSGASSSHTAVLSSSLRSCPRVG